MYKMLAALLLTFFRAWLCVNDKCALVAVVIGRISIFRPVYAMGAIISSSMNSNFFAIQQRVSVYLLTSSQFIFNTIYSFKIRFLITIDDFISFLSQFYAACSTCRLFQSSALLFISSAHGKVKPYSIATLKGNFYETNSRCRRRGGWS